MTVDLVTPDKIPDEIAKTWDDMQTIVRKAEEDKRGISDDEMATFNKLSARHQILRESQIKMDLGRKHEHKATYRKDVMRDRTGYSYDRQEDLYDRWKQAFRWWLCEGEHVEQRHADAIGEMKKVYYGAGTRGGGMYQYLGKDFGIEPRQMSTAPGAGGDFTHPEYQAEVMRVAEDFSGMRQVSRVITTSTGSDLHWPTLDDVANEAVIVPEGGAIGTQPLATGQTVFKSFKYSSEDIVYSWELAQDSLIDLVGEITLAGGERIGRKQERDYTLGNGTTEPEGILTVGPRVITGAAALSYPDWVKLKYGVDPAYARRGARLGNVAYLSHYQIMGANAEVVGGDGHPLWQQDARVDQPATLLGAPYVWNQHMQAAQGTGNDVMMFGDFSRFIIRDVAGMFVQRKVEQYAGTGEIAYVMIARSDSRAVWGTTTDAHKPVALLRQA